MIAEDLARQTEKLRRENKLLEDLILQVEERLNYWRIRCLAAANNETLVLSASNRDDRR